MELEIWNRGCAGKSISLQNGSEPSMQARRQTIYLRGHGTPHVLASKAQSQSEGKFEPLEKIALEVENQSEVRVEQKLQRSVTLPLVGVQQPSAPQTTGLLICLPKKLHSEVKVEPKLWLSAQDQINVSLAAKGTSDHKTSHVPLDEIALEAGKQSVKRPMNEKTTEWILLITSVLLEAMSAVFDQVGYALMGMVISLLALFLSSLHLICKARKEGVKRSQPSGDLLEYYGLAAAVWQCFYSTMEYPYTLKNQQNPIKICLLPFIFALFVLLFSLFKCRT